MNPILASHAGGSIPSWGWWGITCGVRKSGGAAESLALDTRVLEDHARFYDLTVNARGSWLSFGRELTGFVGSEITSNVSTGFVEAVAGDLAPGFGTAKWLVQRAWAAGSRKASDNRALAGTDAVHLGDQGTPNIVEDLATLLGAFGKNGLPMVIFVEDIHEATSSLSELLEVLVTRPGAVLIVSTGWPGFIESNSAVGQAMHQSRTRLSRVRFDDELDLPAPFPRGAGLGTMVAEEVTVLVKHHWTGIDDQTARKIANRYSNPLAIKLLASIEKYETSPKRLVSDFATLPRSVEDLYRVVWTGLPKDVRRHLAVATLGIPSRLGADGSLPTAWDIDLITNAAEAAAVGPLADFASHNDFAWSEIVGEGLRSFLERAQMDVAAADDEFFDPHRDDDDKARFWHHLTLQVLKALDDSTDDARSRHAAWLGWALYKGGKTTDNGLLLRCVKALIAADTSGADWVVKNDMADFALARIDPLSRDALSLRAHQAVILLNAQRFVPANIALAALVADHRDLGAYIPDYAWALYMLAQSERPLGMHTSATEHITLLRHLIDTRETPDLDYLDSMTAGLELTLRLRMEDDLEAGVLAAEQLVDEAVSVHGPDSQAAKSADIMHYLKVLRARGHDAALQLLDQQRSRYAPGSSESLYYLWGASHVLADDAEELHAVVALLERALEEHRNFPEIPEDHWVMYEIWHQLGLARWDLEMREEAISGHEFAISVMGESAYPVRVEVGEWYSAVGRHDEALAVLTSLAHDPNIEADRELLLRVTASLAVAQVSLDPLVNIDSLESRLIDAAQTAHVGTDERFEALLALARIPLARGNQGEARSQLESLIEEKAETLGEKLYSDAHKLLDQLDDATLQ
ncbi:hypothetical protein K2F54_14100 [Cryobacterium sp. 1639]|uniref:tetratricopeptide repeat protein n=1 Tax=Cryobacterium inferilacus TaxID=2866629 RepID=UPI001C7366EF|nr:hypothetical protein [Cryobacterium sp. 1639]MBX0301103.1 hypothetical protein [Cryobacterium sp. 1639]